METYRDNRSGELEDGIRHTLIMQGSNGHGGHGAGSHGWHPPQCYYSRGIRHITTHCPKSLEDA